ncbi:hypothetical protein PIB30_052165 [Stylosanthes scabra]|uniref:RNase H type-1 domain-containing protein n=1 Tax=Stylosanthes scabra TaxID=79078 RepID=A0ABU6QHX3_9FABA|nr:hypothetical protein [Stylosanthes scabra]
MYLLKVWRVQKRSKEKRNNMVQTVREERIPLWWQCCYCIVEEDKYIIGGYFTDEWGVVKCWMGEEWRGGSQGEAYLAGIKSAVQFLLEDMNMKIESIILVSNRKDIIDWVRGKETTCWDTRFLRNKSMNLKEMLLEVQLLFKNDKEFGAKSRWEELAKDSTSREIRIDYVANKDGTRSNKRVVTRSLQPVQKYRV